MSQIKSWDEFFLKQRETMAFSNMLSFIDSLDYSHVFPKKEDIFNSFKLTPLNEVKVVILGQDPYHQKGQAMGLSFSVPEGIKIPPSLRNIFIEMANDVGGQTRTSGDLTYLARQGVFLFNTILTVEESKPLSHKRSDYATFTLEVIKQLNNCPQPIVFLLWGGEARKFSKYINGKNKLVLEANHPSPLSANRGGFFGCKHFSKTNEYLNKNGIKSINW